MFKNPIHFVRAVAPILIQTRMYICKWTLVPYVFGTTLALIPKPQLLTSHTSYKHIATLVLVKLWQSSPVELAFEDIKHRLEIWSK